MCSKAKYVSRNDAFGGAIRASGKTGKPMRAYYCDTCKKWHLTSKKR